MPIGAMDMVKDSLPIAASPAAGPVHANVLLVQPCPETARPRPEAAERLLAAGGFRKQRREDGRFLPAPRSSSRFITNAGKPRRVDDGLAIQQDLAPLASIEVRLGDAPSSTH